jgi:hypothetical protein
MGKANATIEYEMGMTEAARHTEGRVDLENYSIFENAQHFANNICVNFKFIIIFKGSLLGGKVFFQFLMNFLCCRFLMIQPR